MDRDTVLALLYLRGFGSLWRWADHERVITWPDGTTIAFREELAQMLASFVPRGLPPLLSVLVLLSATRSNWLEIAEKLFGVSGLLRRAAVHHDAEPIALPAEVLADLNRINAFPAELRSAAKAVLVEMVFENCTERTPVGVAEAILRILRGAAAPLATDVESTAPPPQPHILRNLRILKAGLQEIDAERLALRLRTGLDETPEPAEDAEIPPGERVRGLLTELRDDAELGGLVSLTRDLMAAMTLPRAISEPDVLPQGGVSDLTNRGPLDRLLLSELANDDLTLAVRVATGSALYWRRERPPQPRPRQRSILLEAGVRSWGVPRVFATAVALAVAATADKHTTLACHRAKGDEIVPVDLTARAGLTAHLAALTPEAHPGAALAAFAKTRHEDTDTDAVLVLGEDVYADRDFQRALTESGLSPILCATVNREGNFTLLSRGERGSSVLREAKLDLDKLYPKQTAKPQPAPLLDPSRKRDLPAIMSMNQFPLRLPHNYIPSRMGRVEGFGILQVTRDRRLLLWDQRGYGPRQLAEDLPPGTLVWNAPEPIEGKLVAVVGRLENAQLTLVTARFDSGGVEQHPLQLTEQSYLAVCAHNGWLFVIHRRKTIAFDLLDGRCLGNADHEGVHHVRDRFFLSGAKLFWIAITHNGQAVTATHVWRDVGQDSSERLLTMFECPGVDGPVGVTQDGRLCLTASHDFQSTKHQLFSPIEVKAISRRGDRIVLSGNSIHGYTESKCVDVLNGTVTPAHLDFTAFVERFSEYVQPLTLRTRFKSIYVDTGSGKLTLCAHSLKVLALDYSTERSAILLKEQVNQICDEGLALPFAVVHCEKHSLYDMRCAEWSDGSKVYLDRRGLLHLKSADVSVPEVTIVLKDGPLAGWCADGTLWGEPYFTGQSYDIAKVRHVWDVAIEPFVRRLP